MASIELKNLKGLVAENPAVDVIVREFIALKDNVIGVCTDLQVTLKPKWYQRNSEGITAFLAVINEFKTAAIQCDNLSGLIVIDENLNEFLNANMGAKQF